MKGRISHVIGFDDAPFPRQHRGDVRLIGAAFSGSRLEGVLSGSVRRDGANATRRIVDLVTASRFVEHNQLIMLQGIAFAGFNVVDIHQLSQSLHMGVLVVVRKQPDVATIRQALLYKVPGGRRKWRLIERAGPMEPVGGLYVQRAGISLAAVEDVLQRFALYSAIPEPLRTAHIIAGGLAGGHSRQRV